MISDAEKETEIDALQEWFRQNDQLPQEIDRILLKRFYQCMYGNVEDTKKLIMINYDLRHKYSHVFLKRDPTDASTCATFEYADLIPLPGLTPEKYKVSLYRLCDFNPNKVRHIEDTKAFFLVCDYRFSLPDIVDPHHRDRDLLADGEVQIFDMTGYSLKHLTKLNISALRIYTKFLQNAFPVRLRSIHLINCPPYLNKIISVIKPFISAEVYRMIHFHTENIESLYEYVPRELLPKEYGGNAGEIGELKRLVLNGLTEKRDYLMDPKHWKIGKTTRQTREDLRNPSLT